MPIKRSAINQVQTFYIKKMMLKNFSQHRFHQATVKSNLKNLFYLKQKFVIINQFILFKGQPDGYASCRI